jgi:hypothetical protein
MRLLLQFRYLVVKIVTASGASDTVGKAQYRPCRQFGYNPRKPHARPYFS